MRKPNPIPEKDDTSKRKRNHTPGPSSHQHGICVWWVGSSAGTHAHEQAKPNTRKGRHQQKETKPYTWAFLPPTWHLCVVGGVLCRNSCTCASKTQYQKRTTPAKGNETIHLGLPPTNMASVCGGWGPLQELVHMSKPNPIPEKDDTSKRKRNHTPGPSSHQHGICVWWVGSSEGTHAHAQAKLNTRKGRHQQRKRNHTPGPSSHQHGICVWWVRKPNLL